MSAAMPMRPKDLALALRAAGIAFQGIDLVPLGERCRRRTDVARDLDAFLKRHGVAAADPRAVAGGVHCARFRQCAPGLLGFERQR